MSLWKLLTARWGSGAGQTDEVRIDASTNTLQVIDYEHHEIHAGSHYYSIDAFTLQNGDGRTFGLTTNTKEIHMVFDFECTGETELMAFEGSTFTTGTTFTFLNNNRNSTNTTTVLTVVDPTVTSSGTEIEHQLIGVASNPVTGLGGQGKRDSEIILKTSTAYLWSFSSNNNDNNISYWATWYEHTPKNP